MDIDKRLELFEHRFREYLNASITYAELQEPYQPLSSEDEIAWLQKELRQTITQAITNTGDELLRLADYEKAIHTQLAGEWTGISLDGSQTRINPHLSQVEAIDTLKKHITKVTGVE